MSCQQSIDDLLLIVQAQTLLEVCAGAGSEEELALRDRMYHKYPEKLFANPVENAAQLVGRYIGQALYGVRECMHVYVVPTRQELDFFLPGVKFDETQDSPLAVMVFKTCAPPPVGIPRNLRGIYFGLHDLVMMARAAALGLDPLLHERFFERMWRKYPMEGMRWQLKGDAQTDDLYAYVVATIHGALYPEMQPNGNVAWQVPTVIH